MSVIDPNELGCILVTKNLFPPINIDVFYEV